MRLLKQPRLIIVALTLTALVVIPMTWANAAGGSIAGTVTDPKGAVVAGAKVTIVAVDGGAPVTVETDKQGKYKVDNLVAGAYIVTISATGFLETRRDNIVVDEGKGAEINAKLEIEPVTAGVSVSIGGNKANRDPLYQKLRQSSTAPDSFAGDFITVKDLVIKRDAGTFTFRSGEIYFPAPVDGRTTGAVFIGDGEFHLVPPIERERLSLAIFTEAPELREPFTELVMRFTDTTFDDLKKSPNATVGRGGAQAAKARDLFREKEALLHRQFRLNLDLRILIDMYAPPRPGFFFTFIEGKKFSKLVYSLDPLSMLSPFASVYPEEIQLVSYGDNDRGIWTAFHLTDEYLKGTATNAQDQRTYDIQRHEIDTVIKGNRLTSTDVVTFTPRVAGQRVIPFDLVSSMRVSGVRDEAGHELEFVQQARNEDADFAVILPQSGDVGKTYKLTIEYSGDGALVDVGGGNYFLGPRSNWYPNNAVASFGDRATFELTFHYPKGNTLVAVGALTEPDKQEGDTMVAHWTSGQIELQVAGFNYGRFKRKAETDPDSGLQIEYYANNELPDFVKDMQNRLRQATDGGQVVMSTLEAMTTTSMAESAIADTKNATRIYNAYFGKLPFTRIAMSQQPADNFGQAWPTLVYMPFTAFLDDTTRVQLYGVRGGTNTFWAYVGPHEVAHQWWGHAVGWTSYHDQWMSEGFAEFSASLYAQLVKRDNGKFNALWEQQRRLITEATPRTMGRKPYTVGPVTQGYRLNNGRTGNVARAMIYPKGAYILHMLRMMMQDNRTLSDQAFMTMMKEFVQNHLNKNASTDDFQDIVEKHITPGMDLTGKKNMNWFFNEWVYGTDVPAYKFDYRVVKGADGKPALTGSITQSGVSNGFAMPVPIYADYGKGFVKLGSVVLVGNTTYQLPVIPLPAQPRKATLCAMSDVLYTSLEVNGG